MNIKEIITTESIKKILDIIGIALVVFVVLFCLGKACKISDRNSELKGEITQLNQMLSIQRQVSQKEIKELKEFICKKNEEIIDITADITVKDEKIQELSEISTNLEQEIDNLNDNQKDIIINKLKENVTIWKQKFTLAESIIRNKDKIIFNLQDKYNAQLKVSLNYRELYEKTNELSRKQEIRIRVLEKKQRGLQIKSILKTVAIGGLAGYLGYRIIKK